MAWVPRLALLVRYLGTQIMLLQGRVSEVVSTSFSKYTHRCLAIAAKPPNSHKYSPWRRAILVPFWTLQTLFLIVIVGILALALGVLNNLDENNYHRFRQSKEEVKEAIRNATKVVAPVWISSCAICIMITFTEIFLLFRRKLTPLKLLILNVIKSTIWTALFILDIIAWAGDGAGKEVTAAGVIVELGLVLCFWIPLVYGSLIFYRSRKNEEAYNTLQDPASQNQHIDLESVPYPHHTTGLSGQTHGQDPRCEHYKQSQNGDVELACHSPNPALASPVPQGFVQHHDGQHHDAHEIDSSKSKLS